MWLGLFLERALRETGLDPLASRNAGIF